MPLNQPRHVLRKGAEENGFLSIGNMPQTNILSVTNLDCWPPYSQTTWQTKTEMHLKVLKKKKVSV